MQSANQHEIPLIVGLIANGPDEVHGVTFLHWAARIGHQPMTIKSKPNGPNLEQNLSKCETDRRNTWYSLTRPKKRFC